ncbi:TetR/AcrR family transcriptional regulator [Metabacillus sp. FJAT-53654]|uniref:TetR/AcrR family transcriptional regulator n=1 Tax=Metabacillus rhizosphaerae TaxID=3117747 RepID=A0ABZ2MNM6_9BACI
MAKVDRRILKSQEAIKNAVIELMSEKKYDDITIQNISDRANVSRGTIYLHYLDKYDLLEKLIEEHIHKMEEICESTSALEFIDANLPWFEYLEQNYLFFSTMLASKKGAPYFRNKFHEFLIEEFKDEVDVTSSGGKNYELQEDIILQFIVTSYVGLVEWWLTNEMPYPAEEMAKQVGILLDRNI